MDTKWNSTSELPAEYFVSPAAPRRCGVKAWTAFLAFFLGVSLTLGTLAQTAQRIAWEGGPSSLPTGGDWQETQGFRDVVAEDLKDFLVLGAGGQLDTYDEWSEDEWYVISGDGGSLYQEAVTSEEGITWFTPGWGSAAASSGFATVDRGTSGALEPVRPARDPDADYQDDKNVLYIIRGGTGEDARHYTNTDAGEERFQNHAIAGYNFYLTFREGKASIIKDGQSVDIYGGGYYDGDSQWFVPGYENFPAGKELEGVTVYMAVKSDPIRYYSRDYQTGQTRYMSTMYAIVQRMEETRNFYLTQAVILSLGVLFLLVWFLLRKDRHLADAKLASWTVHVWTEARVLAAAGLLLWMLAGSDWQSLYWRWEELWWQWYDGSGLWMAQLGYGLLTFLLSAFPALLVLGWLCWLVRNDHRYNPKEARRSLLGPLFRSLRARDLKRPVEKRLSRTMAAGTAALALLALLGLADWLWMFNSVFRGFPNRVIITSVTLLIQLPLAILSIPVFLALHSAWRSRGLAEDLGKLSRQVEDVRAGELGKPLILPEDGDLRQTAESLNDIQSGMKKALEEQTRSERMKVELVSNVSHDLKTPLTSILSYAELLRQEDLPPAAADYARIIDEKAQRLKGMVQDVFEVSKAAADQLPVKPERLDLGKLLRQTLADMDGPIQQSALAFKVDLPETPVMIVADGKRLYRVFQNLIDNALRYALEGSRVYLTLTVGDARAEAAIRNTSRTELPEGVDFTARFVRGDASRTDGGSGLGLSIARSFTEACGGEFRVETLADLFTAIVTFPLAEG